MRGLVAVVRVPAIDAEFAHVLARRPGCGQVLPSVILEFFGSVNSTMSILEFRAMRCQYTRAFGSM